MFDKDRLIRRYN